MRTLRAATDTFGEMAAIYIMLLLGAAGLFALLEDYSFMDSPYWAGTTATSTGYGDISPKSTGGRILAVLLMHVSIFIVAPMIIVRLIDRLNENRDAFTHEEQQQVLDAITRIESRLERIERIEDRVGR